MMMLALLAKSSGKDKQKVQVQDDWIVFVLHHLNADKIYK